MNADPIQQRYEALFGSEFGHGKGYGLARLNDALAVLGVPQNNLPPVIHVAGTNGKGSTIAFMRAIAEAAGLSVHAFTKPHLTHLKERFLVAGVSAEHARLIDAARRVAQAAPQLSQFEAQVAAALILFSETPADLCLIETGLGGRDDATNVFTRPIACVLTPIGLDHQDVLGASLAGIAAHKAGILKPGAPAIVARQHDDAQAVIEAHAARIGAPLFRQGAEWDAYASNGRLVVQTETRVLDLPLPSLHGLHQFDNAGLAAAALLASGAAELTDDAVAAGVSGARWPGRMQPLTRGPLAEKARAAGAELWIDGGHNVHAAQALARTLDAMNRARPAATVLIAGMRARKDWRGFLDALAPHVSRIVAVPLSAEGAAPESLAAHARAQGLEAEAAPDLVGALETALAHGAERILVCGSLLLAGEALAREA